MGVSGVHRVRVPFAVSSARPKGVVGEGGGEPTSTSTCVAQPSPAHAQIINYYGDAIVVMYVARQRQAGSEKKPGSVRSPYSRGACEATRRQRGTDN